MEMKDAYTSASTPAVGDDYKAPIAGDEQYTHHHVNDGSLGETRQDILDMHRLGKQQVFKRNFSFLSTLGFISIYMATWEFVLVSLAIGLINGGFAGLLWTFLGTVLCYSTIVASLAEMASMSPTSGGQYHWTSEFGPARYQKFLSYASGWMSTLGWLASTASSVIVCSTLIQSMLNVSRPDFAFPSWQYTLLALAFLAVTIIFNTYGARILPQLETFSLFGHLAGFIVVLVPLWVMCPRNSAEEVFTSFVDNGGWGNIGTACLVSQTAVLYCNLGSDSVVHIAEEVEDASITVPRVMWWSFLMNLTLGIIILITMLFCIGPLDQALEAEVPYIALFKNTGSDAVALALIIIIFLLIFAGNFTCLATASREMWAFSRDKGFPFSRWISKMEEKYHIPFNAVYLTSVLSGVLCLINLGSELAFNIIISLTLLALLSTYAISIGSVLLKRINGESLPAARWSLGRAGIWINGFAFFYCLFSIVFACFPSALPVDTSTANWAPAVWAGVIVLSVVSYFLHGRRHYTPPVTFVEGKRVGGLQGTA